VTYGSSSKRRVVDIDGTGAAEVVAINSLYGNIYQDF